MNIHYGQMEFNLKTTPHFVRFKFESTKFEKHSSDLKPYTTFFQVATYTKNAKISS